nr:MAG TPA: hypothetical protein [Caudoviricetes sp.]
MAGGCGLPKRNTAARRKGQALPKHPRCFGAQGGI